MNFSRFALPLCRLFVSLTASACLELHCESNLPVESAATQMTWSLSKWWAA